MIADISTSIAGLKLNNPVVMASGTFGYGDEMQDLVPLKNLGAITTKTITLKSRPGNRPPRLAEVGNGILNSIGLQNVGVERFLEEKWGNLRKLPVAVIVSIAGETPDDYVLVAERLRKAGGVRAIELNLSCPNLKKRIVCQDEGLVREIVAGVKKVAGCTVIAKLSPQVADIGALSLLAQDAGADALALVNTFPGMAINISTWRPKLSTVIGGGGITVWQDAVEFLLAGASAVSIGTANFVDPLSPAKIADGIKKYLAARKLVSLKELIGKVRIE
jgi:dihydroorotate dehydrogenase (NAD+) catalytic subunit